MIIKSISWKQPGFQKLLEYIMDDKRKHTEIEDPPERSARRAMADRGEDPAHEHDLIINDKIDGHATRDEIVKAFEDNEAYRTHKRKNSVMIRHEILSFSPKDKDLITKDMLKDIAEKYLEIRGSNGLCVAKPHINEEHMHIHAMISGNGYKSKKALRVSKADFASQKREIEAYQIKKYPALTNSIVQHARGQAHGFGKQTDKEALTAQIARAYEHAENVQGFYDLLEAEGLTLYARRDQITGVRHNNRKYRFPTLGLHKNYEGELTQRESRLNALQKVRGVREPQPQYGRAPETAPARHIPDRGIDGEKGNEIQESNTTKEQELNEKEEFER